MNILAIDTTSTVMTVAVVKDERLRGEITTHHKKNHSIRLMPAIRMLFEEADMKSEEIDRIVVSEGPGSYTGVRIGVTTAKTMAWSLGVPLVGVSSMEMLAQNGRYFNGLISPFYDARRGQVFTGLYRAANGIVEQVEKDQLIMHEEWLTKLKDYDEPVLFFSPDIEKHEELIREQLASAVIAQPINQQSHAAALAAIGATREPVTDIHAFTPTYLRIAEAEANWLKRQQQEQADGK
ncbi:tRNA (adenosine(37)-N6)-threonylcarbamoyltransferase complex dimerization subunit type 1 TsaB [Paenalkalicoccus suaedae]|uniref:tRNA (Adenosine(37)-N6)-threonylcarbamoyltransferase complex dimerization subunit type 1 TsaB n=1 Tax=Paenalkalicoccus suaedae TaxID=2592382 RepID=A0A859FCB4_9BACI|nr:tRNA (adenosine(37)-N6)-threonylcarbamoyltransferase complex dimerization subunit type 1 TsaB [Paenalkalicoccus suaedae]QKS70204.1 tRNA (adenosine(37)-N6)-threonylcarbamoyltransferase complex dimerization subunit type 1 TsaB [Paenalkalicoccus suaedae]